MRQTIVSVSPLLAGTALLVLGNGALGTLLVLGLTSAGHPSWVVGLMTTAYFAGLVLGTFYGHRLISGVGHIRTFAALGSSFSAATLAHPFLVEPTAWASLRFVEGFCIAGMYMCTESWLNERASNELRGSIFSLYQIVVYAALGGGQFLLNLGEPEGFGLFVVASIVVSLAVVPVAVTRVEAPAVPKPAHFGLGALYAVSPLGVVGCVGAGAIIGSFYGLGPYFARQVGMDVAATTQFMGVTILGGLALQWPIGRLSDRFDRRAVLVGLCAAICIVSLAAAAATGGSLTALLVLAPVFGGVVYTLYPLSVAHANDFIDPAHRVPASGGLLVSYAVGAGIGPLGASALMSAVGAVGLFGFAGAVALITAMFALWRMLQRPAAEDQAPFQPVPRTTPVAYELDPRVEPPMFDFTGGEAAAGADGSADGSGGDGR